MVLQKTWVAQKFSSNFTDLAVSFFAVMCVSGSLFFEVAHRLSKLKKSQSSEFCVFFKNDVWTCRELNISSSRLEHFELEASIL